MELSFQIDLENIKNEDLSLLDEVKEGQFEVLYGKKRVYQSSFPEKPKR